MRMMALVLMVALTPLPLIAAPVAPSFVTDAADVLSTQFTVSTRTAVPGKTLAPGAYTIRIVDHLSNRVILQITDQSGKVQTTFLALTGSSLNRQGNSGPIAWSGNGSKDSTLRGFSFPGSNPVEFVYPKTEAVAIAKQNTDKVLAIDPESDNLKLKNDQLSQQDMQVVTLWTLASTRVGPDAQPAIEASRYQAPPAPVAPSTRTATPAPTLQASNTPPAGIRQPAVKPVRKAAPATAPDAQTAAVQTAHKPQIAVLPHTASNLPEMLVLAVLALLSALGLRQRRLSHDEV